MAQSSTNKRPNLSKIARQCKVIHKFGKKVEQEQSHTVTTISIILCGKRRRDRGMDIGFWWLQHDFINEEVEEDDDDKWDVSTLYDLQNTNSSSIVQMIDDDALQRLLGDIIDQDMNEFRDFLLEEDDYWKDLVLGALFGWTKWLENCGKSIACPWNCGGRCERIQPPHSDELCFVCQGIAEMQIKARKLQYVPLTLVYHDAYALDEWSKERDESYNAYLEVFLSQLLPNAEELQFGKDPILLKLTSRLYSFLH